MNKIPVACLALLAGASPARATLFTFDDLSPGDTFPVTDTVSGLTAHLSGTGQSYSIQRANALGFTPSGFSGSIIYPSSVYGADLLVSFSAKIVDFSIVYAPNELACDSSATMRVTAYLGPSFVGTATTTAPNPGTWPTGLLAISPGAAFDNVVVHYDAPPPTGGDYGPEFIADNMNVTPAPVPEPTTLLVVTSGLVAVCRRRRMNR